MLKIALTGNIASGKSAVEECLKNNGFVTLCLDEVTHDIYKNDIHFQNKLIEIFNTKERSEIAKIVFESKNKIKQLEEIIFPIIEKRLYDFLTRNEDKKVVVVVIPMLFEKGFEKYFDKIIFVAANENIRLNRLIIRNNLSYEDAKKRIQFQMKQEDKIKLSDYIIENNGTKEDLIKECKNLIKEINTLL